MFRVITASLAVMSAQAMTIKSDYRPPEGTVPWHDNAKTPDPEEKEFPRNYFVPHFGEDDDIRYTKSHIA